VLLATAGHAVTAEVTIFACNPFWINKDACKKNKKKWLNLGKKAFLLLYLYVMLP
jgi:hypothetical protein